MLATWRRPPASTSRDHAVHLPRTALGLLRRRTAAHHPGRYGSRLGRRCGRGQRDGRDAGHRDRGSRSVSDGKHLAPPGPHRPSRLRHAHHRADGGGRADHLPDRHRNGVAGHHVQVSVAQVAAMGAADPAGNADLHHRLHLCRRVRVFRTGSDRVARPVRLDQRQGLLVSRDPLSLRRHIRHVLRALPLCLPDFAGELPEAVGVPPGGQPDARAHGGGNVLLRRPAPGAAGHRGRRLAGHDGMPERHRSGRILRRQHADCSGFTRPGWSAAISAARRRSPASC